MTSDDNDGALGREVRPTDRIDAVCGSSVDGTKIDHEDLIFLVINQEVKRSDHREPLAIREIAAEHRVLDVVATPAERRENLRALESES